MITATLLRAIAPRANPKLAGELAAAMTEILPAAEIATPLRLAHFLAQAAHESDGFRTLSEYWGPTPAQRAYEGRKDLGNVRRGDSRLYRGRGIFQLTGRANYRSVGEKLGLPLEAEPALAAEPHHAVRIAAEYWTSRKLNEAADADQLRVITRRINGGLNGLADRSRYLTRAKLALMPALVQSSAPSQAAQSETDPLIGPDSPSTLVRLLQNELNQRNYDCGAEDGRFGALTRAAVLALKANEGLETATPAIRLSAVTAAKAWVIADRQEKTAKDLRRAGDPAMNFTTRIKAGVAWLLGLFGLGGGATAIEGAGNGSSFFDHASDALGLWERLQTLITPLADIARFAVHWLWLPAVLALVATWLLSRHCEKERLAAYKSARML
ncbi:MAG: hypothetical protein JNJ53_12810 [Rhizobiales bacterium]|nr:hypothetical protein [Hyphomicrobiales bacterium]